MSYDYTEVAQTAQRLVAEYGRTIQLIELGDTSAAEKPWQDAITKVPLPQKPYKALNVGAGGAAKLGIDIEVIDFIKKSEFVYIIATTDDLSKFHKVFDSAASRILKIEGLHCFQPGDTRLFWIVGAGG